MTEGLLQQAADARLRGDNEAAIAICRDLLAASNDPDAASLMGVSLIEIGRIDEGAPLVEDAARRAPENWRFLLNLSVLYEARGDLARATDLARKASLHGADQFETWGRFGNLAGRAGDFETAAGALKKALTIRPDHPELAMLLAGASFEIADYESADSALDVFEKAAPGHPEALKMRTHIARQTCNWEGLVRSAKAWLNAAPQEDGARVALAYAYAQAGLYARAVEAYAPLTSRTPQTADHLATLAKYLLGARDLEASKTHYQKALALDANHAEANSGLSRIAVFLGDFDGAANYARLAIKADPRNVDAYGQLALASSGRLSDDEIKQLSDLGDDPSLQLEQRALSWFGAGDGHHRKKDAAKAFVAWSRANQLKLELAATDADARYDRGAYEALIERTISCFSDATLLQNVDESEQETPVPIFIVGMPRSGTTLLESAIGAHSRVGLGGELPVMPFANREFYAWADEAGWRGGAIPTHIAQSIREKYYAQYQDYGVEIAPFITDKQPNNFLCVGLIRQVFPEAKIIHIRRNPVETGFSIFRRNFARAWQFANTQADIAHYYALHALITAHWSRILDDTMAFIQYEDLVKNFEAELRRLVAFCGLEWEQDCLEYYKQKRTVITFSTAQVRRPPSPEFLNSTGPYETYLAPLVDALKAEGVDLKTGALITR